MEGFLGQFGLLLLPEGSLKWVELMSIYMTDFHYNWDQLGM